MTEIIDLIRLLIESFGFIVSVISLCLIIVNRIILNL